MDLTWQQYQNTVVTPWINEALALLDKIENNPNSKQRAKWVSRLREISTDDEFEYFEMAYLNGRD